jgi:flagellar biosynthesis regulator FlaF
MRADAKTILNEQMAAALSKRAALHEGEVRRLLDERAAQLDDGAVRYALPPARASSEASLADADADADAGTVAVATEQVVEASREAVATSSVSLTSLVELLTEAAHARSQAMPTADTVDHFRRLWSTVRTESQLRQSMQQAPDNAGPLNSAALVHRAIGLMRGVSAGYLQHFLSYVDDLSTIEALLGSAATAKEVPRVASVKKRARVKGKGG